MSQTERTILSGLLNDSEFCKKTIPFLQEEYFIDRVDKTVFRSVQKFVEEYKGVPSKEALLISIEGDKSISEDEFSRCKTLVGEMCKSTKQDTDWLVKTTEKFCQDKAIYNAILESIQIIDGKDKTRTPLALPEILSKALAVSFDTDVGHDFLHSQLVQQNTKVICIRRRCGILFNNEFTADSPCVCLQPLLVHFQRQVSHVFH